MYNIFRRLIKGLLKCNILKFLYYNFLCRRITRAKGAFLLPGRASRIRLYPGSRLMLEKNLLLNMDTRDRIKSQTYLIMRAGSTLRIRGDVHIRYGSTIEIRENANASFGHFTSNTGLNVQCDHSIYIGDDCQMGRNVTIYDSTYHPVGTDIHNMKKNMVPVRIEDHVWLGAHVVVLPGTNIGCGSMIGMRATVSGVIPPTAKVAPHCDSVLSVGNLWARSMDDLAEAEKYCTSDVETAPSEISDVCPEFMQACVARIRKRLIAEMSGIDFETNTALVDSGVLDSLRLMTVVCSLSDEFGVDIPYTEVCARNFNSLSSMAETIMRISGSGTKVSMTNLTTIPAHEAKAELILPDICETEKPVVQRIYEHRKQHPDDEAIIADDHVTSYRELWEMILVAQTRLKQIGVQRGDRIIVRAEHSAKCIAAYYAVHLIGAILVPVEKTAKNERISNIASDVGAMLLVGIEEAGERTNEINCISFDSLFGERVEDQKEQLVTFPDLDDPCEMVFTTGTTGKSKGVLMTHRHISWYAYSLAKSIQMKRGNRFLITTPLNHAGGLRRTHLSLANGCTLIYVEGISDLQHYFAYIEKYHATALYLPPVAIRILLTKSGSELSRFRNQIDFVYSSSSFLPSGDGEKLRQLLPYTRLYNAYEASETPGVCVYDYNVEHALKDCLGLANEGVEIGILEDDGNIAVHKAAEGQICVRSRMNMSMYYGAPELTASVFRNGWFISNDLGAIDAEGNLYYRGRIGDVINIGGYKIAPTEVEEVALLSGMVDECICVQETDDQGFEYLKLLVIPKQNEFDTRSLTAFMGERLETYKLPQRIEITEQIYKTFNGKIDRKKYRQ